MHLSKSMFVVFTVAIASLLDAPTHQHLSRGNGGWFSTSTSETSSYPSAFWHITKIELDKAWDIHTGHYQEKIAHIDTGIRITHSDLTNRIDTVLSVSFSPNSSDPFSPVIDHGTDTASVLGAQPNNGNAVGVDWHSKIVCIRADGPMDNNPYGEGGHETFETIYPAIQYATQHGIPIISYSGGLSNLTTPQINQLSNAVAAYQGLFVCAAGNENSDLDQSGNEIYPHCFANADNVLVVGASTPNDLRASFSNYGQYSVDVFAPGTDIVVAIGDPINHKSSGTSVACPLVAGVAALIRSVNRTLTTAQIKSIILNNVDPVADLSTRCVSGGRINAYKALKAAIPEYVDGGNGMSCQNGVRPDTNEWVKISGYGGYKNIHSTGFCPADGALYSSDINAGPIASATADSDYPFNYHILHNLSSSSTYYLKSVVQLPLSSSFGVQIENHLHHYDSFEWISYTKHASTCSECGHSGVQQVHMVSQADPTTCLKCGGPVSMGIVGPDEEGPIVLSEEQIEGLFEDSAQVSEEMQYA